MKIRFLHIILLLLCMLPMMAVGQDAPVRTKPKTLKELVAEEKAQKEAQKKAKQEEMARLEEEKKRQEEERARIREQRAKSQEQRAESGEEGDITTPESVADWTTNTDSVIWAPTQVKQLGAQNYGELTRPVSSLDLQDPDNVTTSVEYQPETGTYVIRTRMGNTEITTPYLLTQEEYNQYAERQIMHRYWQQKIGEVEHNNESKFDITDMKFNIGPADKVFGPGGVQLKMQGSADLMFGFKHQYIANPSLTPRARNNNIFDFDEKIQASIQGKVGQKLTFNLTYNTEASFAFDQQNVKLNYKGEEDDIIQSIEAGNVTMDLPSSLIRGSKALFGIKTNLKFGKFRIQALVSQQNSQAQTVSSKGGAQLTKFDIAGDNYDENRHFFLSHFFRDNYEKAMESAPYISSGVTINKIEVWITNKRGNYDQARNIVAFVDLGENNRHSQMNWGGTPSAAPDNKANDLYTQLQGNSSFRQLDQTSNTLGNIFDYSGSSLSGGVDYEKVESARLLTSSEYTLNSALGYISLKSALNQDEVLAVAYEYTYNGQVKQVGEFSTDQPLDSLSSRSGNMPAIALKLLKSTANAPSVKGRGTWDLMMKNIYSLGATSINSDKFELYVTYRNDSIGTEMQYLNEGPINGKQLLRVMNLDRLDQKNNASPDGRFDFLEGTTILASSGKIIFPVLEPFGDHLAKMLEDDPRLVNKYCFPELYDSTLIVAQELSEKNKFRLTGKYKGTNSSEIRLGAMNVPRGSVTVTAGGATLIENVDYTVDYTMGTVTILNTSILESGANVDVKLENQSTFSMQRKSLFGVHLEYEFNKDLTIGGTVMHLRERPLTTKVSTGSEPLANTIWGLNGSWKTEMQWLTNAIDKVPWITATAPSTFAVNAEFAHLIPGHTNDAGAVGMAYIDDFESTTTNIDVHYPTYWFLASTPDVFPESHINITRDTIGYNKNRAHLAWYTVDPIFGYPQSNTPAHIRNDLEALSDHRTRIVYQDEVYPNRQEASNVDTKLPVLNLAYYPDERGQYNISADEIGPDGKLTNPQQRWGGIMRRLDNTDFEKANIEYIQFWLMDPTLTNPDHQPGDYGKLYINLGDMSEDILRDGKKAFEHGMPVSDADMGRVESTPWGLVPRTTSTTTAFSNESGAREKQDVGLNGLNDEQEKEWPAYKKFIEQLKLKVNGSVQAAWEEDAYSPFNDPAGDNYHFFRGSDYDRDEVSILDRYKHYNGTQGNSPATEQQTENYGTAATLQPDIEDINQDNTLNEYERYFQYEVSLRPDMLEVGRQNITEKKISKVTLRDGKTVDVTWYQFKIPLRDDNVTKVGTIRNWKSIRFMRMYMTGFNRETVLRFATMDLVRGEWRQYTRSLEPNSLPITDTTSLSIQTVNIEENSTRWPVNYVLPPGVSRQTDPGQAQLIAQNEQAMSMRVMNLAPRDARAMYKNVSYDLRQYKKLQMFVHAEQFTVDNPNWTELADGELTCFLRIGSDLKNNYYEYEIPLKLTEPRAGGYNNNSEADRELVWPEENMFDFALSIFPETKTARNKARRSGNAGVSNTQRYEQYDGKNKVAVLGNPTLEDISSIMIGVRNRGQHTASGEVWVNELRLCQFNEQGGVAAMVNASLGISDIAQVNVAGRMETAGYGSIEANVMDRNMDNFYQVSVSAALEAGRLIPEQAKIQLPLYVAYSKETTSPEFDPLDSDVRLSETMSTYETGRERDSIAAMTNTVHESLSFSATNMKLNQHYTKKRDLFIDPANFSVSAAYNKQTEHSPEIETNYTTDHKGSFQYSYNFNPKPWEPFGKVEKVAKVKVLKEMNFYYLPQSWAFNTNMHRTFSHMKMRDLAGEATAQAMDLTYSKDFTWDRNVDIKYDLTKNMKFTFQSSMNAIIDEGKYTPEILNHKYFDDEFIHDKYAAWKDTIQRSLARFGKPYSYQQVFTASWNIPFNRIPYLDPLTTNASYNANYNWTRNAASTGGANLGNTVSSVQTWQIDGAINFENWYGKSKYWKQITQLYSGRGARRTFKPKTYTQTTALKKGEAVEITHRLNSELLTVSVADSTGKHVPVSFRPAGNTKVTITPKADCAMATVTVSTRDPNQRTPAQVTGDMFTYLGTMIRKLQVTYRETNSMTLPGFAPEAGFMGQSRVNGAYAPGFDFAFGFIPGNMVERAKNNGWLVGDTSVVQPATRAHTQDIDIKLTLEPLPGLKVQLTGKRYYANSTSIIYSYEQFQETMTGSFNITQCAIGTIFGSIGSQEQNFANGTYDQFLQNRIELTGRVQDQYNGIIMPTSGFLNHLTDNTQYDPTKHGTVNPNSADVLVPAFLAAYTGRSANSVSLNPFLGILSMLPNWSITYDGLGRLPWMRDHFKSVTLTHAYTCKYAISSYNSYSTWVGADGDNKMIGFVRDVTNDKPRPSSAYDISNVTLTEAFSPLIGLNMTMKNSLNVKAEYRKQRNLALNVTSAQLTEGHTSEFVIGAGYTVKNLNFIRKGKDGGEKKVSNDLKLQVDFSYKDVKMLLRKIPTSFYVDGSDHVLDRGLSQASSGNKVLAIKISADYVLSQKINIQLFYDHQGTTPLISSSYPVKTDNVGLNIKLMLTR